MIYLEYCLIIVQNTGKYAGCNIWLEKFRKEEFSELKRSGQYKPLQFVGCIDHIMTILFKHFSKNLFDNCYQLRHQKVLIIIHCIKVLSCILSTCPYWKGNYKAKGSISAVIDIRFNSYLSKRIHF